MRRCPIQWGNFYASHAGSASLSGYRDNGSGTRIPLGDKGIVAG